MRLRASLQQPIRQSLKIDLMDIDCGIQIGICRITTGCALMLTTIIPGNTTTGKTTLAGMSGNYLEDGNAALGGFIFNKVTKLTKGLGVLQETSFFGSANSLLNTLQVLHNNYIASFTGLNNHPGNSVVKVSRPTMLLSPIVVSRGALFLSCLWFGALAAIEHSVCGCA
jgi:hypothetical protein